jgi:hypothetical protein
MPSRARIRVGRKIAYTPTAAEATADGAGPWYGEIIRVYSNGTADLRVTPTVPATLADDPTAVAAADADGTYGTEEATLINECKDDFNIARTLLLAVKGRQNNEVKTAVQRGGGLGQWDFVGAGSDSV